MREAGLTVLRGSGKRGSSPVVLGNGDFMEIWSGNHLVMLNGNHDHDGGKHES
jgi:hypothetical protein